MVITEANGTIINTEEVYVHDDTLISISFDRITSLMKLEFKKYRSNDKTYHMYFENVLCFEMTNCDFWGASECVLDFEYVNRDSRILIPKLLSKWQNTPDPPKNISYDNYLETVFTFTSGDQLRIVCKSIEFKYEIT